MVLPLLFGLLGSGLASSGILGGMGALTAGAIGSGLGSAIETGDIGKGISSGLLSFMGGKLLGGALGAEPANLASSTSAAALGTATDPAMAALAQAPKEAAKKGLMGMFGNQLSDPTKAMLNTPGALGPGMLGGEAGVGAISKMTSPQILPYVAGAQAPNLLQMFGEEGRDDRRNSFNRTTDMNGDAPGTGVPAPAPITRVPPPGYRPGYDPEFDYQVPIYRVQNMAEGGLVGIASGGDKDIVSAAVAAIKGESDDPQRDLGKFLMKYGEAALNELIDEVEGGGMSEENGEVSGAGDGMSDAVPAKAGEQDIALSDGEFVVPADVVSHIGNGSSDAGSRRLQEMMDRVRAMRTGNPQQPEAIDPRMAMPA